MYSVSSTWLCYLGFDYFKLTNFHANFSAWFHISSAIAEIVCFFHSFAVFFTYLIMKQDKKILLSSLLLLPYKRPVTHTLYIHVQSGYYIITNNIVQHLMSGLLVTFNVNKQFEEIIAKISKQLQR